MAHARIHRSLLTRLLLVPALAALALTAAGCGQDRVTYTPAHGGEHSSEASHAAEQGGGFSHADIMFAEMMIPHHEQAIEMAGLAQTRSTDERVKMLASRIKFAQQPEIDKMKAWVDASGMGGMHGSGDHSAMGGMLSEQQMAQLKAAKGVQFDRLFLTGMIAHHEGAIDMAAQARASENAEVADLANTITSTQTSEIVEMKAMLARMP